MTYTIPGRLILMAVLLRECTQRIFWVLEVHIHISANRGILDTIIEYGFSNFRMKLQEVDLDEVNLNTSARGRYLYVTPMLFYQFGGKGPKSRNNHSVILGLGAGLGYLGSSGNMVFTEKAGAPVHDFDVSGLGTTINIVVDYRIKNWMVRIRGGGPSITEGDFDYDIFEFSFDFGYSMTL